MWQHVVLCKGTYLRIRLTVYVRGVLRCDTTHIYSQAYSQQHTLTQHYMLPQHATDIRELINECFYNDFY